MKVYDIKAAVAAYLKRTVDQFNINSVDLILGAINQVRLEAELLNNFEFSRKLLTLDFTSDIGGSLDNAVIYGTNTLANIKSIVDVGVFDEFGNLRSVEWTTVADSLNRERVDNPRYGIRYPTDAQAMCPPLGQKRFVFSGRNVFLFSKATEVASYQLGIEAYTFTDDWTSADNETATGPWLTKGHQFLQWKSIIQLNHICKAFVFRQEGNLAPPDKLADTGLENLISWDTLFYEQTRRHER